MKKIGILNHICYYFHIIFDTLINSKGFQGIFSILLYKKDVDELHQHQKV